MKFTNTSMAIQLVTTAIGSTLEQAIKRQAITQQYEAKINQAELITHATTQEVNLHKALSKAVEANTKVVAIRTENKAMLKALNIIEENEE